MKAFENKYEDVFPFPDRSITPKEKTSREYTKAIGEAIYTRHLKNKASVSHSARSLYKELREYGTGEQSEDKYKGYLQGGVQSDSALAITDVDGSWTGNKTQERKGWMNVLWDIISPAQMIRDMIHGLFDDIDFDIVADAVDADSGAEEENEKWKRWVDTRSFVAERLMAARAMAGVPIEKPDFVPDNIEELEQYAAAGGFKMVYAMETEKLLRHIADFSDWMSLKAKVLDDIIDLYTAFVKADYDKESKKIKWRYVDPEDLVMQHSKYHDYRDSKYGGEFHEVKITDLRRDMLNEGYTEEEIKEVAESYCGMFGNPAKISAEEEGSKGYDNFTTIVFSFEWIDDDITKKIKFTNSFGKVRYIPFKDKKLGKREEVVKDTKRNLYQGNWVIGTDIAYDYGKVYYQPKPQPNEVELTYKGFRLPGKSLTARLYPLYDNIQIGWLLYQNGMAQQFQSGYTVDWRMLQNISDGEKKYSPLEIIKMWKETGILLFMSTPIGQSYRGGASRPVDRLEGGMGETLNEAMARIQMQFMLIERMTGFSPVALGATPNPDAPVTTTERSLQATHNSIKPMMRGIFTLKNALARVTSPRLQQLLKYNPESRAEFEKVIGKGGVKAIMIAQDSAAEYGIRLQARPSLQEKMDLLETAKIAMQPGRDGIRAISYNDYMYIVERLHAGGNIKEIRMYLTQARKRVEKQAFKEKQALIKQQTDGVLKGNQDKMRTEAMIKNMDVKGTIAIDNNKARNDLKLTITKINGDYMTQLQNQTAQENVPGE